MLGRGGYRGRATSWRWQARWWRSRGTDSLSPVGWRAGGVSRDCHAALQRRNKSAGMCAAPAPAPALAAAAAAAGAAAAGAAAVTAYALSWDVDVMHDISFALTPPCSHYPSRWCQCDAIKSGYSTQTEGGGLSITWTLCGARIT